MLDAPLLQRRTDCPVRDAVDGRRPGGESSKTQARDGHVSSRVTRAIHADQRVPARRVVTLTSRLSPRAERAWSSISSTMQTRLPCARHGRSARTSAPMRTCPDGRTQEDASHVADRELRSRRHHRQRSRTVSVTTTEAWPRRWLTMWTGTPAWKLVESNVPTTLNTPAGAGSLRGYSPGW